LKKGSPLQRSSCQGSENRDVAARFLEGDLHPSQRGIKEVSIGKEDPPHHRFVECIFWRMDRQVGRIVSQDRPA
jgi:hypothetical protein